MGISKSNIEFVDSLIDYYIEEAKSYKQIAESYVPEIESVLDTTFGIITGCIYSSFLQAYANQKQTVGSEDVNEFNKILKEKAPQIKNAILGKKPEEPPKVEDKE